MINPIVNALQIEIKARKQYLSDPIRTIYFGGGSPSILSSLHLAKILGSIFSHFPIGDSPEITLEANPEDVTQQKCEELLDMGFNRMSIGVQTFDEKKLVWMNRAHNSSKSVSAIRHAKNAGFENLSLDLIYAIKTQLSEFKSDLTQITQLDPQHVSLYGLTIEERTVFKKWKTQKKLIEVPEEDAASQYKEAVSFLTQKGYDHYEVSNFGKPGFYSRHNIAYWNHEDYLGIGPGAHSYDGNTRRFNVRNNAKYLAGIQEGTPYYEEETLSKTQQVNERILTGLRTIDGIDTAELKKKFHVDLMSTGRAILLQFEEQKLLKIVGDAIRLTDAGFLVADEIVLQLFFHE